MKPRILISGSGKCTNYIAPVEHCGGEAVLYTDQEWNADYDGLLLCGGGDVHPSRFGEEMNGTREVDLQRDEREFALIQAFVEAGKPILGICRGCQILNIYFGGSLIQHIDCLDEHWGKGDQDTVHEVVAVTGSLAYELYGERFSFNSYHHQALKKLGKGLWVTMRAGEIIEGIQHESLPIIAFQGHPERMSLAHSRIDTINGLPVFEHFLSLCRRDT